MNIFVLHMCEAFLHMRIFMFSQIYITYGRISMYRFLCISNMYNQMLLLHMDAVVLHMPLHR